MPKHTIDQSVARDIQARLEDVLGPELAAEEPWRRTTRTLADRSSRFYGAWVSEPGGHKKASCFPIYDKVLHRFIDKPVSVLEIGVFKGASIRALRSFLGEHAVIVGLDINPASAKHADPSNGIFVEVGDQGDESFISRIGEKYGPFDVVIDDGSHLTQHQINAFKMLFDKYLKYFGTYIIEDTNTSLLSEYRSGAHDIFSLVNAIVQSKHAFYSKYTYDQYSSASEIDEFRVSRISKLVDSVSVYDAAVVVEKSAPAAEPPLVHRNL